MRCLYILGCIVGHFLLCLTRHLCMYMSEDNVIPYIEHWVIRTCHNVKLYHKDHKRFMYICHRTLLYHRTLCGIDNKMFVYKYVKTFWCQRSLLYHRTLQDLCVHIHCKVCMCICHRVRLYHGTLCGCKMYICVTGLCLGDNRFVYLDKYYNVGFGNAINWQQERM